MIFEQILKNVDEYFSIYDISNEMSDDQWQKTCIVLIEKFKERLEWLISIANVSFLHSAYKDMEIDYTFYPSSHIVLCISTFRALFEYLSKNGYQKSLNGTWNSGMQIEFELVRRHVVQNKTIPPLISLSLKINGKKEQNAFKNIYYKYKDLVGTLLNNINIEFQTGYVIERLEKYKGDDIGKKLDLYFKEVDEENSFSLITEFTSIDTDEYIIKSFLIFMILYDSCFKLISSKGKKDLFIEYFYKLSSFFR